MKSFHSYSSSFLFSKLFTRRFGYTEAREGVKENDNLLVVEVLVREVQFLSVGVFSVNEVEYELFMKCVDYATLSDTGSAYTLAFTKEGSRLAQLPARLDSPYSFLAQVTNPSYITCTSAKGGKPVGPVYTLYSGDTKDAVVAEDGSLAIEDADHKQRIAFYIGTTLSSRVDIESAQRECSTALCELLCNQKSVHQGTLCMTPEEITIYDETDLQAYRFACTTSVGAVTSIEFEGEWYAFVTAAGRVHRRLPRTRFPPRTIARWRTDSSCERWWRR